MSTPNGIVDSLGVAEFTPAVHGGMFSLKSDSVPDAICNTSKFR